MAALIGQSLGRYHILEQLGEGGMATVYKAYDTRLEREVALKIVRKSAFSPEVLEHVLKRFERETKALSKLTHPNIVGILDYGTHEDSPYIVMVFLAGQTLKQQLGKPIPWQTAVRILLPIAQALEFAHEHKVIHRDIKPSNILLTDKNQPMLSDFGIAKLLESEDSSTLTGTGMGMGTPGYMAPEQWTGQSEPRSDIYSLGVVLFELVTGSRPYRADTPAAVLIKQVNEPLPRPSQFIPGIPEELEKLLFKALAKNPEDRFSSMTAMLGAMEKVLIGIPTKDDLSPGILLPGLQKEIENREAIPEGRPRGKVGEIARRPSRRSAWMPWLIGITVVVLAGLSFLIGGMGRNWTIVLPAGSIPSPSTSTTTQKPSIADLAPTIPISTGSPSIPITPASAIPVKGCMVTSGGVYDESFSDQVWSGIERGMADFNVEGKLIQSTQTADYTPILTDCKNSGAKLIICVGVLMTEDCRKAAVENPKIYYAGIDMAGFNLPNFRGTNARMEESTFLAGYLAAGMTKTGKIGWFTGVMSPGIQPWGDGFYYGIQYYNQVYGTSVHLIGYDAYQPGNAHQTGSWIDVGKSLIEGDALMGAGADIILPVVGPAGTGTAAAIKEAGGGYMLGVDNDWAKAYPQYSGQILASILKNFDGFVYDAIERVSTNTWAGGDFEMNLENVGTALVFNPAISIPITLKNAIAAVKAKIISGEIVIPPPKPLP